MPHATPHLVRSIVVAALLLITVSASAEYKIRDNAPPALRTYLEQALETGKKEQGQLIEQGKKDVASAEAKLAEVRKQYRKMKAKDADLKAAEAELAAAKQRLAEVQATPPLVFGVMGFFDKPGTLGTLRHGFGVSRVIDGRSALIFPFVERTAATAEGKLFTNNEQANKETAPTAKPLLLTNSDTSTFEQGQRRPADMTVYQVGKAQSLDNDTYYTLEPVDLAAWLIKTK